MSARIEAASMGEMAVLDLSALLEELGLSSAVAMIRWLRSQAERRAPAVAPPMGGRGTTS